MIKVTMPNDNKIYDKPALRSVSSICCHKCVKLK